MFALKTELMKLSFNFVDVQLLSKLYLRTTLNTSKYSQYKEYEKLNYQTICPYKMV